MTAWYPEGERVPETWQTEEMLLRPLRVTDVDLDYVAVMVSQADLRQRSQGRWPTPDFPHSANLADLEMHQREHGERVAFTYTVMTPAEDLCLGCLYIKPLRPALANAGLAPDAVPAGAARLSFWARSDRHGDGLDHRLLAAIRAWLAAEWPLPLVLFEASAWDERMLAVLTAAGLTRRYELNYEGAAAPYYLYG